MAELSYLDQMLTAIRGKDDSFENVRMPMDTLVGETAKPGDVSGASTAKSLWPDAIVALGKGLALSAAARRGKRGAPAPPAFGTSGGGVRGGPLTAGSGIKPPTGIGRKNRKTISL